MKFKQIIGGTEEEAIARYPWLEGATFTDAVIDITGKYLVWKDGIWEDGTWIDGYWEGGHWIDGVWKGGVWEYGTWEGGTWEGGHWRGGFWEGGVWKGGLMWSNISQRLEKVVYKDGKFSIKEPNKK